MKKKQLDAVRNSFNQMAHGYGLEPRFLDAVIMLEDETFWRIVGLDDSGRAAKCVVLRSGKTTRKVEPKVIRARDKAGHVGAITRISPRVASPVAAKLDARPKLDKVIIGRPEPSHPESREAFGVERAEDPNPNEAWRKRLAELGWQYMGFPSRMKAPGKIPVGAPVVLRRGEARLAICRAKMSNNAREYVYAVVYTPAMSKAPVRVEANPTWLTRKVEQLVAAGRE